MTGRERVLTALSHEEPDRVPLFIGTSGVTTLLEPAYQRLAAFLGVREEPRRWITRQFGYVRMDEDMLQRLGSDGRMFAPGPAPSAVAGTVSETCLVDAWGARWEKSPGSLYFEVMRPPLKDAILDDLDRYPWPDLMAPARFEGMAAEARAIQRAGCASVCMSGVNIFELACVLRGMDNLLVDMLADEDFFAALLTRIAGLQTAYLRELMRHVGPYTDVLVMSDDLGTQDAPLISPEDYRRLIKPHEAGAIAAVKSGSDAKVFFHSDGNIYPLIGDLVDIGVDILNPVQVSAGAMADTARLKREFGGRLSFNGGIDTHHVLPHGTTDDVRAEVRRRIRDLAPGGGYIASAVHCIQPDVPPQNVLAMCDEVKRFGKYPIAVA